MLIEFSVKNFRSFKELQTLSMTKAKGSEHELSNSFQADVLQNLALLNSSVIYGANSAGKSNLLKAIMAMKSTVLHSASSYQEGDNIPITSFLFDETTVDEPSEFEAIFISDGTKYQYGFSATKDKVMAEWLFAHPKGRPQRWFSRVWDSNNSAYDYKFSEHFLGQKSTWQNSTRENALFLSTATQLNSTQLKPVFKWFKDTLRLSHVGGWGSAFTTSLCENAETKNEILSFMKAADINIHDINLTKEKFNLNLLPNDIPKEMKDSIEKELRGKDILDIKMVHKTVKGNLVELKLDDESDGTQRLFSFAGPWIDALKNGYVLVIDELHEHLHPKMVKFLIGMFHRAESNPHNAQIIFTTHDTSVLNQDIFRRDQVWFCEKNNEQATSLYPLTEFSPRKDRENIEAGYLSGKYGAVPFISDFSLDME
ncbi:AAA family ATPase [Aeromonas caviae]